MRFHLSIDDVFDALVEISDGVQSLKNHPLFQFLLELHAETGVRVDLYVFAEGEVGGRQRTLSELKKAAFDELAAMPWIRFGPHARGYDLPPFSQPVEEQQRTLEAILAELQRLAPRSATSQWLRLHYFSECYELAPWLLDHGFRTLLLTDKDAVAYRLPPTERHALSRFGCVGYRGLELRRSDVRIERWLEMELAEGEWQRRLDALLDRNGCVVLFTHEIELSRPNVRRSLRDAVAHLQRRGAASV